MTWRNSEFSTGFFGRTDLVTKNVDGASLSR